MTTALWTTLMVLLAGVFVLASVPVWVMVERRGSAWMQRRVGPNRVGPLGLLQPMSDAIKLVFKEVNIPAKAHKFLFQFAPAWAVVPPIVAFCVIPFAGSVHIAGNEYLVQVASLPISALFLLAITSLHVYANLAAGWSSNNKFALMGALRSSSQMISYEVAIGISMVSVVMTFGGTLDLREIVKLQEAGGAMSYWGIVYQPVIFFILWVCAFAETNRLPFDLPEGESELVAGYHSEYSGLNFATFMLGEYAAMMLTSAFLATLFLGGYNVPFFSEIELRQLFLENGFHVTEASLFTAALQLLTLILKIGFFMIVFVWVRWTLPRFRYDQLMDLGWKVFLPICVVNCIVTFCVQYWLHWKG